MKTHHALLLTVCTTLLLSGPLHADGDTWTPYDVDRNGYLDSEEFARSRERQPKRAETEALWRFESVDGDKDGRISELELVHALQRQMETVRKH